MDAPDVLGGRFLRGLGPWVLAHFEVVEVSHVVLINAFGAREGDNDLGCGYSQSYAGRSPGWSGPSRVNNNYR